MAGDIERTDEQALVRLSNVRYKLAAARTIPDIKDIRDRAEAIRHYARQQHLAFDMLFEAAEIKLRAERKAGQLLASMVSVGNPQWSNEATITLDELGISKTQSARWQMVARLSEDDFESYMDDVWREREEPTSAGAIRLAKRQEQEASIDELRREEVQLPKGTYHCLVVDPPWPSKRIWTAANPAGGELLDYPTMTIEDIAAFPVASFSAPDAHLYLWTTHHYLPQAFAIAAGWGFTYECLLTWVKDGGFVPFSWMYSTEHVLFCTKGDLPVVEDSTEHILFCRKGRLPLLRRGMRLDFSEKRREHSRKPDAFYALVREASPAPRIDVFSREKRKGFHSWGNQPDLFSAYTD